MKVSIRNLISQLLGLQLAQFYGLKVIVQKICMLERSWTNLSRFFQSNLYPYTCSSSTAVSMSSIYREYCQGLPTQYDPLLQNSSIFSRNLFTWHLVHRVGTILQDLTFSFLLKFYQPIFFPCEHWVFLKGMLVCILPNVSWSHMFARSNNWVEGSPRWKEWQTTSVKLSKTLNKCHHQVMNSYSRVYYMWNYLSQ